MQLGADSRVRAIDREWKQARLEHVLQRLRGRQGVRKRLLSHVFLLHTPHPPTIYQGRLGPIENH